MSVHGVLLTIFATGVVLLAGWAAGPYVGDNYGLIGFAAALLVVGIGLSWMLEA